MQVSWSNIELQNERVGRKIDCNIHFARSARNGRVDTWFDFVNLRETARCSSVREHRISFLISNSRHAVVAEEIRERRKMKAEPGYDLDKGGTQNRVFSWSYQASNFALYFSMSIFPLSRFRSRYRININIGWSTGCIQVEKSNSQFQTQCIFFIDFNIVSDYTNNRMTEPIKRTT